MKRQYVIPEKWLPVQKLNKLSKTFSNKSLIKLRVIVLSCSGHIYFIILFPSVFFILGRGEGGSRHLFQMRVIMNITN